MVKFTGIKCTPELRAKCAKALQTFSAYNEVEAIDRGTAGNIIARVCEKELLGIPTSRSTGQILRQMINLYDIWKVDCAPGGQYRKVRPFSPKMYLRQVNDVRDSKAKHKERHDRTHTLRYQLNAERIRFQGEVDKIDILLTTLDSIEAFVKTIEDRD